MMTRWFCFVVLQLSAMILACSVTNGVGTDKVEIDDPFDDSGKEAVLAAIAKGDLDELKRLESVLNRRVIANLHSYAWGSPNADVIIFLRGKGKLVASDLQVAAARGDAKEVRALLKRLEDRVYPPDSDAPDKDGTNSGYSFFDSYTPLRLAIRRGHTEVVSALIAGGANVNERLIDARRHRDLNEYPLSEAVQLGRTEIVQLLVDGRAVLEDSPVRYSQKDQRVNLSEFYKTHLKSPNVVVQKKLKEMFDAGLIVEERDPDANVICPLVMAIRSGRAKIVSILLKGGANPNVLIGVERRPLHEAVMKGNPEIVRLLIEKAADVNALASDGKTTPLLLAIGYQHGDVADILRAAGAK